MTEITNFTQIPFAAVPNKIAQDPNISNDALALITYMVSHPYGWKFHPKKICRDRNIGRDKWQSVARELIKLGCLELVKGGTDGGAHYKFELYKNDPNHASALVPCREPENPVVDDERLPEKPSAGKTVSRISPYHIKKQDTYKETTNYKETTTTNPTKNDTGPIPEAHEVVVSFMSEIGMDKVEQERAFQNYKLDYLFEKVKLAKSNRRMDNPKAWFNSALRDNYRPMVKTSRSEILPYKTPEETAEERKRLRLEQIAEQNKRNPMTGKIHLAQLNRYRKLEGAQMVDRWENGIPTH